MWVTETKSVELCLDLIILVHFSGSTGSIFCNIDEKYIWGRLGNHKKKFNKKELIYCWFKLCRALSRSNQQARNLVRPDCQLSMHMHIITHQ